MIAAQPIVSLHRALKTRTARFLLVLIATAAAVAAGPVIQSTVVLPATTGIFPFGGICFDALDRCTQNAFVSDFEVLSRTVDSGNELVDVEALYSADVHMNNGGMPGMFLGHLSLPGVIQFKFLGRDPSANPLGVFATELTSFSFKGSLNGNTFEIKQNPALTSSGQTTIIPTSVTPPFQYSVTGHIEVLALYSFNGSPFAAAPPRSAVLAAVPEPGSGMLMVSLLVIGYKRIRSAKESR